MSTPTLTGGAEPPYRLRDIITHWRQTIYPAFYALIGAGLVVVSQSAPYPWLAVGMGILVVLIGLAQIDSRMREVANAL